MLEKDFQKKFNKWLRYNFFRTAAFELKIVKGKSMPFSAVKEHQIRALLSVKNGWHGLIYKIPDVGVGQKPFDSFKMYWANAYIVIMFYHRGQKEFYIIDVERFYNETLTSKRKSLTESRAREISDFIGILK